MSDLVERVVDVTDANTTAAQPPGIAAHTLWRLTTRIEDAAVSDVTDAVADALDRDRLFRYEDREGTVRYCVATESNLRRLIGTENQRDDTRTDLVEDVAETLAVVSSDKNQETEP